MHDGLKPDEVPDLVDKAIKRDRPRNNNGSISFSPPSRGLRSAETNVVDVIILVEPIYVEVFHQSADTRMHLSGGHKAQDKRPFAGILLIFIPEVTHVKSKAFGMCSGELVPLKHFCHKPGGPFYPWVFVANGRGCERNPAEHT